MKRVSASAYVGLKCTRCQRGFSNRTLASVCPECHSPLDTVFDEQRLDNLSKADLPNVGSMWRYRAFLPVKEGGLDTTAGEGNTPLRRLKSLKGRIWVKEENRNPTGTFKDRGASLAISVLHNFGVERIVLSSEGNAGCSFALYSRMAGIRCTVFLPNLVNPSKSLLSEKLGARIVYAGKTIKDAGRAASASSAKPRREPITRPRSLHPSGMMEKERWHWRYAKPGAGRARTG